MILIISDEDGSTSNIIDWLLYRGDKFLRLSLFSEIKTFIGSIEFSENNNKSLISIDDATIDLKSFQSVLVRHGSLRFLNTHYLSEIYNKLNYKKEFIHNAEEESKALMAYLDYVICKSFKKRIGSIYRQDVNKLITLETARNCDLKTPNSIVTSSKENLEAFFIQNNEKIISKAISQTIFINVGDDNIIAYTYLIEKETYRKLPSSFRPTLFQNYIDKVIELRIVYLKGVFYTTAIFSQNDAKTKVDFRRYNNIKPNKCVPYKLPLSIEDKLTKLMNTLNLETGSIDMILSTNFEYVFLEVNPVGQYGYYANICNFPIDKQIAILLS